MIRLMREEFEELVERGASAESDEMRAIASLLNRAEFYANIWRFDLEAPCTNDAAVKLATQHMVVPPHYRLRLGPPPDSDRNGHPSAET
jgi:hypothetical protein